MKASGQLDEIVEEGAGHLLAVQLQPEMFTACCVFLELDRLLEHALLRGLAVWLLCLVEDMPAVSPQCRSTKSF